MANRNDNYCGYAAINKNKTGNTHVHPMAFTVVTYENNRVFDDIKILYTH